MKFTTLCASSVLFLAFGSFGPAAAQEGPLTPWVGERGITETVAQIMERERQRPPGPHNVELDREVIELEHPPRPNPDSPAVAAWPPPPVRRGPDGKPLPQGVPPPATGLPVTVGTSFLAVSSAESPWVPPDTGGAVGPTQILCHENGRLKVFDKLGNLGPLNADADVFFFSVRNGTSAVDPQTKYDRLSGRFIVTAINTASPNRILIAVSSGSSITGAGSFTFYQFTQDAVAPAGNFGEFADYDKVGVDANAVYVGANMFGGGYTGSNCFVVRKTSILAGGPIIVTAFRGIADAATGTGPVYPMGVDNDDPTSTEGYVAGVDGSMFGRLAIRRISNPGGAPSISANLFVTTPTTVAPIFQPALGSTNPLDVIEYAILFDVQMHRDRVTGARTLWAAHHIEVDASGVATSGGGRNGSRWYQIGSLSTTPTLVQSGTLFDPSGTNPKGYIFPSCAMSGQGHVLLGATFAGSNDRAGCAVASRLASDAPGTISAPTFAVVSSTNYNVQSSTQRWGDMSKVDVDPTDDQTMWAFIEYCSGTNQWGVRVIQLRAPAPVTPSSASPASLPPGATNQLVVLTGTSAGGSGFYDTEPGFSRLQVSVSGFGVTVSNIAFDSPTQLTLTVSVSPAATAGPRLIQVINPDGQSVLSAPGVFSVGLGAPGTPYCFGDGSLSTACPCANFGGAGRGCANSANAAGAVLGSSGTVSPDSVVLAASGERPTALTVFFQGNANTGAGIVYGDGVRCASGNLIRLYKKNAVGGAVSAPQGAEASITATSAAKGDPISPGMTRYYFAVFRDPVIGFCPPNTFNATNGVQINW
jgi:hypothetical protein